MDFYSMLIQYCNDCSVLYFFRCAGLMDSIISTTDNDHWRQQRQHLIEAFMPLSPGPEFPWWLGCIFSHLEFACPLGWKSCWYLSKTVRAWYSFDQDAIYQWLADSPKNVLPNAKPMSREQIDNKSLPSKPVGSSRKLRSFATSYDWVWKFLELPSLECSMYHEMHSNAPHAPRTTEHSRFSQVFPEVFGSDSASLAGSREGQGWNRNSWSAIQSREPAQNYFTTYLHIFTSSPPNVTYVCGMYNKQRQTTINPLRQDF